MFAVYFFVVALLSSCTFTTAAIKNPLLNTYLTEINMSAAPHGEFALHRKPSDRYDKIFTEVFTPVTPQGCQLVKLDESISPSLCEFVHKTSDELGIRPPLLYLSLDEKNVDIKCATYNQRSAFLLHSLTFSSKNSPAFRGYLRTALSTLAGTIEKHQNIFLKQKRHVLGAAVGSLASLLALTYFTQAWGSHVKKQMLMGAAGILSGSLLYHTLNTRITTISYQRIPSFDNREEAREDLFPGQTCDSILIPVYNGSPDLAVKLILQAQSYIQKRNKEFAEQQECDKREFLMDSDEEYEHDTNATDDDNKTDS